MAMNASRCVCLLGIATLQSLLFLGQVPAQEPNDLAPPSADGAAAALPGAQSFEIHLESLEAGRSPPVVTALAVSHDGRFLAAAGDDHAIRIIDAASGHSFSILTGHQDWIQALVFSSDSRRLFSAGNDGRILQWTHGARPTSEELLSVGFAVRSLSLSTTRELLAIAGFSDQVLIVDSLAGSILHRLQCDSRDQRCVRFSPDGNQVLSGGRNGHLRVWNSTTGQQVVSFQAHRGRVHTAAFSADGSHATSVGDDRRVVRYDLENAVVALSRDLGAGKLMSMCLINDDVVAGAGADNTIHLYDISAGRSIADLKGHWGTVAEMCGVGDFLISGSFDTTVRVWDLTAVSDQHAKYGLPVTAPLKMDAELQIR